MARFDYDSGKITTALSQLEEANTYLQEQKNKFGTMMSSLESSFR